MDALKVQQIRANRTKNRDIRRSGRLAGAGFSKLIKPL
jgi:hypothetical protein